VKNYNDIEQKLEDFSKKYYTNELIRGVILFSAIGLLYFLLTVFIEYVFWLPPSGRVFLFWLFILVELFLVVRLIAFPILKIFRLKKGITKEEASLLIGNHFQDVNDKLLNVLQLGASKEKSELLLASIEQKAESLKPIPFKLAVNFRSNVKYLKYAAIPALIILGSFISDKFNWFSDSYERVINYQTAYESPAPFQFYVINDKLSTIQNQSLTLVVEAKGEVVPEYAEIDLGNEQYYMKRTLEGLFEFTFENPIRSFDFNVNSNGVRSRSYRLEVVNAPSITSFEMLLDYPSHTKRRDEVITSSGNAEIPNGTKVKWLLGTNFVDDINIVLPDTTNTFAQSDGQFSFEKRVYKNTSYAISVSNEDLPNYETLSYNLKVINDQYPEIRVQMEKDSSDIELMYFFGQLKDDYGLKSLNLVYYPINERDKSTKLPLSISKATYDEFVYTLPRDIQLPEGQLFEIYFELIDNDAINGFKKSVSETFQYRKLTSDEVVDKQLQDQNNAIENISESLDKLREQENELNEISKSQKEKSELNFNDKKKLENFLERQLKQEKLMQDFNKKLKDDLEDFNKEKEDTFKENLEEHLKENQEQLKKDEALLKELQKIADKINKEELAERLEQLAKQNKNKKRSMEQLLELTKRYYVTQKSQKLKADLEKLAEKQEELSNKSKEENTKEEQDKLNKEFEDFTKELDELKKENEKLKQPVDLPKDKKKEDDIKKEQQNASENLDKQEGQNQEQNQQNQKQENAKKSQKKAAQKMKQMSEQMNSMLAGGGMQQMGEDIEMLRQILDNLLLFSFDQEDLLNTFKSIQINHNEYAKNLIKQQNLREHFEHVDDSLFTLSLRQPKLSEQINKEITEVYFNIDKALAQFSENRLFQGTSAQQYAVTSANTLASYLSDALDNMEMQMNPSPGQGQGEEQLPDIIMSQQQLNEMMKEGMEKEGEKEREKEGEKNKGDQESQEGEEGKTGKEGDSGANQEGEGNNQEDNNGLLFEIYKKQQQLRQALEDKLGKEGSDPQGDKLLKDMEEVELDLINKGFTNQTLQKMMELEHQLLKLENAAFKQGEDNKRTSKTSEEEYNNTTKNQEEYIKKYFGTTEILNRQTLPLRGSYKKKVQEYFKKRNDSF